MPKPTIATEIATNVRARRRHCGMTRKELARAADVSERYLSELEVGGANVSIGILSRVASALQVDVLDLLSTSKQARDAQPSLASPSQAVHDALLGRLSKLSPSEQQAAIDHLDQWLAGRRRPSRGVALLGLRGAGKTTIGMQLADRLGVEFVSITREIEARAGMGLGDLFNLGGPDAYRALEDEVIGELIRRRDFFVVETAGGIVGNAAALERVLSAFTSVWIKAQPTEHLDRVVKQGDVRPMRGNPRALEHLESLLSVRQADYGRAEYVLDTSGRNVEACVAELENKVRRLRP